MIVNDHSDADIRFLQLRLGGDRNFTYLLGDARTGEGAAVDPGFRPERIAAVARDRGLLIRHVLITHGHPDHTGGAAELAALTGARIRAGRQERVAGAEPLEEGEFVALGARRLVAFHTPGHAPGHFCFLFEGRLLTGDLLFCGKVGGTGPGFPGSSDEAEWNSLHRLLTLPGESYIAEQLDVVDTQAIDRKSVV